jgi:hypothetical protein
MKAFVLFVSIIVGSVVASASTCPKNTILKKTCSFYGHDDKDQTMGDIKICESNNVTIAYLVFERGEQTLKASVKKTIKEDNDVWHTKYVAELGGLNITVWLGKAGYGDSMNGVNISSLYNEGLMSTMNYTCR